MEISKIKWYIIWFIWLVLWLTAFTNWWSFDSFTGMNQWWFDAVKLKLNWIYTSGKMCTSDWSWAIQCTTTIPTPNVWWTCGSWQYVNWLNVNGSPTCLNIPTL
jgi:hypothetical protein